MLRHIRKLTTIFDILANPRSIPIIPFVYTSVGIGCKPKNSDLCTLPMLKPPLLSIQCGEDALFTRPDSLGVADGVGGWNGVVGANAALYSLNLMHYCSLSLKKFDMIDEDDIPQADDEEDFENIDAKAVLAEAYTMMMTENKSVLGSTTALICILRGRELRIAYIGDCGVLIVRSGKCIFRSEEQQHSFNFPVQLGTNSRTSPADALAFSVPVMQGDVVICGSDGLFDNVYDSEIVQLAADNAGDAQKICDAILKRAKQVSEDISGQSPFQDRAVTEGFYYQGGKIDDISVVVGIVGYDRLMSECRKTRQIAGDTIMDNARL